VKLRNQEYEKIDAKLDNPLVHFVPKTKLGRDVQLDDLRTWGLSAIILANGAWRDRPLPIPSADDYVDRGLYYQNPFTYWFNHFHESSYKGPQCDVDDEMIVVGGGLASIDIVKMLQLVTVSRALEKKGIHTDIVELEHAGVPKTLAKHNLEYAALGLKGCTLFYRRTAEDMPLADPPDNPTPEQLAKSRTVSAKLLGIAMKKYLFNFQPQRAPAALITEGGRLKGIAFHETRIEGKKVEVLKDKVHEVRGPITISSIGSIPLPIPGLPMKGETYEVLDEETGTLKGFDDVYAVGNAVTGKGNINVSYKHARVAAEKLLESYLVGDEAARADLAPPTPDTSGIVAKIADRVKRASAPSESQRNELFARVKELQTRVGYGGSYKAWIESVKPV
jgi:NADPH-dependent glutamate synthase beta subunit-like oxidoreductase